MNLKAFLLASGMLCLSGACLYTPLYKSLVEMGNSFKGIKTHFTPTMLAFGKILGVVTLLLSLGMFYVSFTYGQ